MFKVGDLVYYGKTGVCEVIDVKTVRAPFSNKEELYYQLKPMYQSCFISVPVDNDMIYLREIISEEEVTSLINSIPEMDEQAFYCSNLNQLKDHYRQILDSRDNSKLLGLIISVSKKRIEVAAHKKKLGAVDEKFLKDAKGLLYGEFAAVLKIPKHEVENYIINRIKNNN